MSGSIVRLAGIFGVVLLVACSDDPTGTVTVDVVEMDAADRTLVVGDSTTVTAVPLTADGDIVVLPVLWRSLNPTVAVVRAGEGMAVVEARGPGTARIEAEAGGRVGFVTVTVIAAPEVAAVVLLPTTMMLEIGDQTAIRAHASSEGGAVITGRAVTWTVEPAGSVRLWPHANPDWIRVEAIGLGAAVIRATVDGVEGEADVQVVTGAPPPAGVATVVIAPAAFSLPVGHETPLEAIARDASGGIVGGLPVTWTSSALAVATVTPIGQSAFASLRTLAPGTVIVRAEVGGVVAEATVQVTAAVPPPQQLLYLNFNVPQRGVWLNQVLSYASHLVAMGPNGQITDPAVTWTVDDVAIATVSSNGSVIGVSPGTTRVRATSGDLMATALVTVFAPPGPTAVFDLTWDWWDGQWHMAPEVYRELWTDENGEEHTVALWPTRGSLRISDAGQYERVIELEGWAWVNGIGRKVIERAEVDRGTATIMVGGETGYRMMSATRPGYEFAVVGAYNAGHVTMRAVVGLAPEQTYLFRLRQ